MTTKTRSLILCLIQSYDGIINVWLRLWWVVVFVGFLRQDTLSYREMICSVTGLVTSFAIAKRIHAPKLAEVWIFALIGYISLLALFISPDAFLLYSSVACAWGSSLMSGFKTRLTACNMPDKDDRTRHDNWINVAECIAGLLGAGVFWLWDAKGIAPWAVWMAIYALFDVDMVLTTILLKKGILAYNHEYSDKS